MHPLPQNAHSSAPTAAKTGLARWVLGTILISLLSGCLGDCGDDPTTQPNCPGCECQTNSDCEMISPFATCTSSTFQCRVQAPFGDECGASQPCAFGDFCSELIGRCFSAADYRDCVRRDQCPTGQLCDRGISKCIPVGECFADEFCDLGEFCDQSDRSCKQIGVRCGPCRAEDDCSQERPICAMPQGECVSDAVATACKPSETCSDNERCIQCESDSECGTGLFCNESSGRCEPNVQCRSSLERCPANAQFDCGECGLPLICDEKDFRCKAPVAPCDTDLDCENLEFCDTTLPQPVCASLPPACANDPFDTAPGNNSAVTATALAIVSDHNAILCPGDTDWYRLNVPAGTHITIDLRFDHAAGDVDAELYGQDGSTVIQTSRSITDNERLSFEAGSDVELLFRAVLARPSAQAVPYTIALSERPGTFCAEETEEENDSPGDAKLLSPLQWKNANACAGDADWWRLENLTTNQILTLELEHLSSFGNLDLELYRSDRSTPVVIAASDGNVEEIAYETPYTGHYLVRVVGRSADQNTYRLRATLAPSQQSCSDDVFESNDIPLSSGAASATVASGLALSICGGDEDWYVLPTPPLTLNWAEIAFARGPDLDLELYEESVDGQSLVLLKRSAGTSVREFIAYRSFTGQRQWLRVFGHTLQDVGDYGLHVRTTTITNCIEDIRDRLGQGNLRLGAIPLGTIPAVERDQTVCGADEDWYGFTAEAGFAYLLRVQFALGESNIDMELVNDAGTAISSTQTLISASGEKSLTVGPLASDANLTARLFASGADGPYDLTLDRWAAFSCEDDVYEPNPDLALASLAVATATASPFSLTNLTLCTSKLGAESGDEDVFVLRPEAGMQLHAQIQHTTGDLSLELLGPSGTRACFNLDPSNRCFSDGYGGTEEIVFTATTAEPYYLRVGSVFSDLGVPAPPESDAAYQLQVTYTP